MNDPIVIDLRVQGVDDVLQQFDTLANKMAGLGGSRASGAAKKGLSGVAKQASYTKGIFTELQAAIKGVNDALKTGNALFIANAQARQFRAQNAVNSYLSKSTPPTFGQKAGRVLASSRLGIGGNGFSIMPLVGQLGSLLGTEFAVPVAIAAAALDGLAKEASAAGDRLRNFANQQNVGGGSREETASVRNIGDFLGDPDGAANRARAFNNKLAEGGYAAGQFGPDIRSIPGPFQPLDADKNYIAGIKKLHDINKVDPKRAMRMARAAGLEDELRTAQLPDFDFNRLINSAKPPNKDAVGFTNTSDAAGAVARNNLDRDWELATTQGRINLRLLTEGYNAIHTGADWLSNRLFGDGSPSNKDAQLPDKLDDLKNAVKANTRALREGRETIGGGARARGAMPVGLRYQMLNQAIDSDAIKLGAFNL